MIHGPTDLPLLPSRPLQPLQHIQLLAYPILPKPLLRQYQMLLQPLLARQQLLLDPAHALPDLAVHAPRYRRQRQEELVRALAQLDVGVRHGPEEAMAAQEVEGLAGPAQEEEDEDEVPEPAWWKIGIVS